MSVVQTYFWQLWLVCLEAAPWLLLGIVVSGLIKVWLPTGLLRRWLGGRGIWPVLKASLIGTPLPLCSCSVIPAAVTLRRSGASKGSTVSFLISTPENGADSIALSYALLGPFMTIVRPIAAVISSVLAGLLTFVIVRDDGRGEQEASSAVEAQASCCGSDACSSQAGADEQPLTWIGQLRQAYTFATQDLFADIAGWMALGLALAALMNTLVPAGAMAAWGSGLLAMLAVMAVGVPMYICATASTPVAAAMLIAGVSPGTVLVFLLAGPATNLATIGVVRKELGGRALAAYLLGVCGGAILMGLATDAVVNAANITVHPADLGEHHLIPAWFAYASIVALGLMSIRLIVQLARKPDAKLTAFRQQQTPNPDLP